MRVVTRPALAVLLVVLAACGGAEGVADTRRALEGAGFAAVDVTVRSGGGIDVVRVDAGTGSEPARAAQVLWTTLPVRFDQLVVSLAPTGRSDGYSYASLVEQFGARDPRLDRKQITDQVVRDGLDLMLLLTFAALLCIAGVVALGLLAVRAARGRQDPDDQAEGPISGLGAGSLTAADPVAEAEGPEAIPS